MSLYLSLKEIKPGNRESLLNALRELSYFDCDFNGDNGLDYLWEEAKGFTSNMEYLINEVKDIKDDEECVSRFIEMWMERDSSYYKSYELNVITTKQNQIKTIAFAVISK